MADRTFASVDGEISNYNEINEKTKLALLSFCADKAGIDKIETNADVIRAFNNTTFAELYNSIIVDVLESIVLKSRPEQIFRLANVDEVDVGDSKTYEIETKGLPIAQRTSYTTNVTFLDSYSRMSLTVTPKPYSIGTTMDYIRILANNYDMGRELARVAFALLYAQLRLIVDEIYTAVAVFMPQLSLSRNNIEVKSDGIDIYASFTATNLLNYTTNLYNIKLTNNEFED